MTMTALYMGERPLRIGTRQSPLALAQAREAAAAIAAAHGLAEDAVRLVPMVATGDRVQDRALAELGGKALWTKELDRALAEGEIDCAVHSMKDVETFRPAGFVVAAMLPRADARHRLIGADSIDAIPHGARVGTASPRRTAQLLRRRPDLDIALIRGNVATRLARVEAGEFAATLLAAAGLDRLGHRDIGRPIAADEMLPAPSQGAIGIETLAENRQLVAMLAAIDDEPTSRCVRAERAFLEALGGDCRSPVAAHASPEAHGYRLRAALYASDGADMVAGEIGGGANDLAQPAALARELLGDAPESVAKLFPR
jgi:hydroxymethylbilane synthase